MPAPRCATLSELHGTPLPDRGFARRRGEEPSVGNTHGRQRGPTVRCQGKPMHRPEQDMCHSCPAPCDDKVSWLRTGLSAIEHVPYSTCGPAMEHVATCAFTRICYRVRSVVCHPCPALYNNKVSRAKHGSTCHRACFVQYARIRHGPCGQRSRSPDSAIVCVGPTPICARN